MSNKRQGVQKGKGGKIRLVTTIWFTRLRTKKAEDTSIQGPKEED